MEFHYVRNQSLEKVFYASIQNACFLKNLTVLFLALRFFFYFLKKSVLNSSHLQYLKLRMGGGGGVGGWGGGGVGSISAVLLCSVFPPREETAGRVSGRSSL